ncbi:MAG: hypothetical protein Q7K57_52400 [Burkholderiaceae bacterium]|nr:hypothetical protein [Burkholderiaceae bacterium]
MPPKNYEDEEPYADPKEIAKTKYITQAKAITLTQNQGDYFVNEKSTLTHGCWAAKVSTGAKKNAMTVGDGK